MQDWEALSKEPKVCEEIKNELHNLSCALMLLVLCLDNKVDFIYPLRDKFVMLHSKCCAGYVLHGEKI